MASKTVNKLWFKNQLSKGNLLVKCKYKYSDDYAFDSYTHYGTETEFRQATENEFDSWYVGVSRITGDKEGIIDMHFAHCESHEFKLKPLNERKK